MSSSLLKPCPACGKGGSVTHSTMLSHGDPRHFGHCYTCGVSGPRAKTSAEAISLWDLLPRVSPAAEELAAEFDSSTSWIAGYSNSKKPLPDYVFAQLATRFCLWASRVRALAVPAEPVCGECAGTKWVWNDSPETNYRPCPSCAAPALSDEAIKAIEQELKDGAPELKRAIERLRESKRITPELLNRVIGSPPQEVTGERDTGRIATLDEERQLNEARALHRNALAVAQKRIESLEAEVERLTKQSIAVIGERNAALNELKHLRNVDEMRKSLLLERDEARAEVETLREGAMSVEDFLGNVAALTTECEQRRLLEQQFNNATDLIVQQRDEARARIESLETEVEEHGQLLDLQRTRTGTGDRLWQEHFKKPGVWPDLGELVEWLVATIELQQPVEEQLISEVGRLKGLLEVAEDTEVDFCSFDEVLPRYGFTHASGDQEDCNLIERIEAVVAERDKLQSELAQLRAPGGSGKGVLSFRQEVSLARSAVRKLDDEKFERWMLAKMLTAHLDAIERCWSDTTPASTTTDLLNDCAEVLEAYAAKALPILGNPTVDHARLRSLATQCRLTAHRCAPPVPDGDLSNLIALMDERGRKNPEGNSLMLWVREWNELRAGLLSHRCPPGLSEEEVAAIEAAITPMRILMLECEATGNIDGAKQTAAEIKVLEAVATQGGEGGA